MDHATQNPSDVSLELGTAAIAFVGAGNMAEALIRGLIAAGMPKASIHASAPRAERRDELEQSYGIQVFADNAKAIEHAESIVLAVKPQILPSVAQALKQTIRKEQRVLSIAAGIPLEKLASYLGGHARLIRAMPNTPALIGQGATGIAAAEGCNAQDRSFAKALFTAVGLVVEVAESLLDAVTGLSGSGPAYVFMIIEALSDAGVKVGLPRRSAMALATQTVLGSAQMVQESQTHPSVLKDRVTSPGGTAIAGLHTLEAGGIRTTLINAVETATQRARTLGSM